MASTSYGVNHPLAVKLWRKQLFHEALKETYCSRFIGTGTGSLIQKFDETKKSKGDRIRVGLRVLLNGAGVSGDHTLEGNEESLVTYSDDVLIDQLRHAARSGGKMSEQRVPFDVRAECKDGLKDWFAERIDTAFFNQITGNTSQTDTKYTGSNATIAPSTNRVVYADANASESTLTTGASDRFKLSLIDLAVARAKTVSPMIRPIKVGGKDHYVCFLDTWQVQDLRTNTDTMGWADIQKAAMMGGKIADNPIFTGALGIYNNVILHETTRLYTFNTDGGTRCARAVLCGAQAAAIAYGRDSSEDTMSWVEEMFDYQNQFAVAGAMVWGLKKLQFNSEDYGTITISTNAEQS